MRQAQLPEIKPANGEPIDTLFGKTSAGSFSPYASDGQQSITLQMVDTEFSILDSLFYPWMKDINSPWWYRPDKVYTEWATPYPMATLEVQRPRMRYRSGATDRDSRKDAEYTYYSYKYIGVKPTNYNAFEVNGGGVSNLLRSLTLSCDMCLVDLTGDVAGSGAGSTNLGNRTGFIFADSPGSGDGAQPDQDEEEAKKTEEELQEEKERQEQAQKELEDEFAALEEEIAEQEEGDMPGEDEEEWQDEWEEDYNEDEYEDPFGDGEVDDSEMDCDEEDFADDMMDDSDFDNSDWGDESEPWENDGSSEPGDPNGDLADYTMEQEAGFEPGYGDSELTSGVQEGMMDVGAEQAQATASEQGWTADQQEGGGLDESFMDKAIGGAVDLAKSGVDLVTDVAGGALDMATSATKSAFGFAGNLASAAMNAFTPSSPQAQAQQAAQTPSGESTPQQEKGLLSTIGDALGGVIGKTQTAFGTVANAISGGNGNSTLVGGVFDKALSCAFPSCGNTIGHAGNLIGGALSRMTGGAIGPVQVTGAMRQMVYAKGEVGNTSVMATALNAAATGISTSTGVVGDVARSVFNAGGGHAMGNSTGDFGALVSRMTSSPSAKPTPLEGFVGMVTKHDATGSSMA